jgi:hypothetical protein
MSDTNNIEIRRFSPPSGKVLGSITAFANVRGERVVIGNTILLDKASPDISLAKLAGAIRDKLSVDDLYALSAAIAEYADTVKRTQETELPGQDYTGRDNR